MPQRITANLPPARLQPYRDYWLQQSNGAPPSDAAIGSLYLWQVGMSAAWYEVLAYTEMIVRQALDSQLRKWNAAQGHGPDWLSTPDRTIEAVVGQRTLGQVQADAERAKRMRDDSGVDPHFGANPRRGAPVSHDDLVAQLTFGNLVNLLPKDPPPVRSRNRLSTGYTAREHLWRNAIQYSFPNIASATRSKLWAKYPPKRPVPADVEAAYAMGAALERLRRIRNRVGHHEQTFRVHHADRHKDACMIVFAVNSDAGQAIREISRVRGVLATQPRP